MTLDFLFLTPDPSDAILDFLGSTAAFPCLTPDSQVAGSIDTRLFVHQTPDLLDTLESPCKGFVTLHSRILCFIGVCVFCAGRTFGKAMRNFGRLETLFVSCVRVFLFVFFAWTASTVWCRLDALIFSQKVHSLFLVGEVFRFQDFTTPGDVEGHSFPKCRSCSRPFGF